MTIARGSKLNRARPWAALTLPPAAWMLFEYGLGTALRGSCAAVGMWLGPAWGLASLMLCVGAALLAWPMARTGSTASPPVRVWLARIAAFEAGIFALAVAYQTLATLIVPSCAR